MDLTILQVAAGVLSAVATVASLIAGAIAWSAKQAAKSATTAAAAARVEPLEARVDALEKENVQLRERQRAMEREIAAVPTKEALGEIKVGMAEVRGDVHAMKARFEGLDDLLRRVETAVTRHEDLLHAAARNG